MYDKLYQKLEEKAQIYMLYTNLCTCTYILSYQYPYRWFESVEAIAPLPVGAFIDRLIG